MFRALLEAFDREPPATCSSLRFLFTAGAAIPVELIHAFEARGLVLKQGFGQTETSILCCLDARDAVRKAGSVGPPGVPRGAAHRAAREPRRRRPRRGRTARRARRGEIVVRGPITMLGYWERPEATAETLRDGWLLHRRPRRRFDAEGFVTLAGRSKDLFISGGENVYPRQVEAVYEAHPAMREIAVVGVPDARWGEVGRAYVVLARRARRSTPAALARFGRERLAALQGAARVRRRVATCRAPRRGKVQKHRLQRGTDLDLQKRPARKN